LALGRRAAQAAAAAVLAAAAVVRSLRSQAQPTRQQSALPLLAQNTSQLAKGFQDFLCSSSLSQATAPNPPPKTPSAAPLNPTLQHP
jgi:hypothetical protein